MYCKVFTSSARLPSAIKLHFVQEVLASNLGQEERYGDSSFRIFLQSIRGNGLIIWVRHRTLPSTTSHRIFIIQYPSWHFISCCQIPSPRRFFLVHTMKRSRGRCCSTHSEPRHYMELSVSDTDLILCSLSQEEMCKTWYPSFVLQHLGFLFLGILTLARFSGAVTASPSEKLWEEIGNVKTMMAAVSGKTVAGRKQNLSLYKNYCLRACDAVLFNR